MESEARYAWVGGIILLLATLSALALYWLQGQNTQETRRYVVYFQNQSLEGLQINSDVRMQGIKVGKVVDYVILPNQAKTVRVELEVDARTPILEGVEAVVARNLVTGLAAVDLNNVWKGGTPLSPPPKGEADLVIEEGEPQIARVAKNLQELGEASQEALFRLNKLLSDDNQRAFSATLNNLAGLSGETRQELTGLGPELTATLAATRQAAQRLDGLGQAAAPVLRDSGQLVQHASQRLDVLAGEAEAALRLTRTTLASLETGLRDTQVRLRLSADLGLQEIQSTAQTLRAAGESIQTTSRDFADPGRLIFGPNKGELGPGEREEP
jgi:phospholipid/cholesterol/gamma-HCH transport system substrate-binding protein